MKKLYLTISLILLLFISGCSGNSPFSSSSNTGVVKSDNTGSGLEVDFSVDTTDILSKRISYNLNILNSGKKTIKLTNKNIKLLTVEKLSDGANIITKSSLDKFYSNIFNSNEISLVQNQNLNPISGILKIDDKYFNNINNDKFSYILNINYDYQTSFSNNVQLDLSSRDINSRLKILDSLSQAAPVKISNINLLSGPSNYEYVLQFKISNSNSFFSNSIVKFSSFEFKFKNKVLNNCKYYINENSLNKEISFENFILNKKNSELILKCLVNLQDNKNSGKINTIVSGYINYNYDSKIISKIDLPKNRVEQTNW